MSEQQAVRQSNIFQTVNLINGLVFLSLIVAGLYAFFSNQRVNQAFKKESAANELILQSQLLDFQSQNQLNLALQLGGAYNISNIDSLNKSLLESLLSLQSLGSIPSETANLLIDSTARPIIELRGKAYAAFKKGGEGTIASYISTPKYTSLSEKQTKLLTELRASSKAGLEKASSEAGLFGTLAYVIYGLAIASLAGLLYLFIYSSKLQRDVDAGFEAISNSQMGFKRQEGMLTALLNSSEDAILLLDKKLKVVMMNEKLEQLYKAQGRSPEVGMQSLNLVDPEEIEYHNLLYQRALKGESFDKHEERKFGDKKVFLDVSYFPIRTKEKSVVGVCALARDVSERVESEKAKELQQREALEMNKKLRESEEKLIKNLNELELSKQEILKVQEELAYSKALMDSVFQNADVMISATNLSGNILVWNRKAEEQLGYAQQEAVGSLTPLKYIDEVEIKMEAERLSRQFNVNLSPGMETLAFLPFKGLSYKKEWTYIHKNGERFPVELFVSALTDKENNYIGLVNIAQDISERIKQQNAILKAAQNLRESKEELQKTLDELKATQQNLVQAEKMASLGQLVAGVAHEVNTPIGIAVTAASYLDKSTQEFNTTLTAGQLKKSDLLEYMNQAAESSNMILKNLGRAAELIQSFKKVAVDQSKEDVINIVLKQYLADIMISLTAELRKNKITYEIDGDPELQIFSMSSSLSQVFINFVMNSIRHAFDEWDGDRRLKIDFTKTGSKVTIRYIDSGKGIPSDILPKIFDPFFTTKRGKGGSGLGLHIVYNIVKQKLDGDIFCHSEIGKGTTFTLVLPIELALKSAN